MDGRPDTSGVVERVISDFYGHRGAVLNATRDCFVSTSLRPFLSQQKHQV